MKKIILLIIMLICVKNYGQTEIVSDSTNFIAMVKEDLGSFKERPRFDAKTIEYLHKKDIVFAFDVYKDPYSAHKYLAAYKDTIVGYIPLDDVYIAPEQLDYLLAGEGDMSVREDQAKKISMIMLLEKIKALRAVFDGYNKIGLVITEKKYAYEEYSDAFGLKFEFYNGYSKAIKYIDITVRPYNRVGDLVKDDFGREVKRVQVIGPLRSGALSTVTFDDMFWDEDDVINTLVITYMKVTFMDGTVREIKDIGKHLAKDVYNGKN